MQEQVDAVPVPTDVAKRIVDLVQYTRTASASRWARAHAPECISTPPRSRVPSCTNARSSEEDVRAVTPLVLTHRMWAEDPAALVEDALRFTFG